MVFGAASRMSEANSWMRRNYLLYYIRRAHLDEPEPPRGWRCIDQHCLNRKWFPYLFGLAMYGNLKGDSGNLEDLIPEEEKDCNLEWIHLFNSALIDPVNDIFVKQHCWKPWCRSCERARVWRLRDRILSYIGEYKEGGVWYFVTRSVRNDLNLKTAFVDLRLAQQKFADDFKDDKENPWNSVSAWIGVNEITYSPITGYNLHQHMLVGVAVSWTPTCVYHLEDAWSRAAGYSAHFNVKRMYDADRAAAYIAKYMSKSTWGGLSRGRSYICRNTLKGRNRIGCKRGTALKKMPRGYLLCCLPPVDDCAHPNMTLPLKITDPED